MQQTRVPRSQTELAKHQQILLQLHDEIAEIKSDMDSSRGKSEGDMKKPLGLLMMLMAFAKFLCYSRGASNCRYPRLSSLLSTKLAATDKQSTPQPITVVVSGTDLDH